MAKIVTLGEIMMRLSAPRNERFFQADSFEVTFGGAEANTAVSLAQFGHDVSFVTKLPDNIFGDRIVSLLRSFNVDTSKIARGGGRLGVYFLEAGASVRPSSVIYDRADSAMARAAVSDFDFGSIFKDADIFHICGITPAISDKAAELSLAALKAAKANGVTVSFDVNFRSKLWTKEKAAGVLSELIAYADICFANSWDAHNLLGVDVEESADFEVAARALSEKYDIAYVIASHRVSRSASDNDISASMYSRADDRVYTSRVYSIADIVDRVGGGDSLAAGILCAISDGRNAADTVEFGVAASALKHTIHGDCNIVTKAEVEALAGGDSSGKVKR